MNGHRYVQRIILAVIVAIKLFAFNTFTLAQDTSPTVLVGDVEWRQLTDTTPISWDDLTQVCPVGGGECSGTLNGVHYDGWNWATIRDISHLFSYFRPDFRIPDEGETELYQLIYRDAFNLPNGDLDLFLSLFDINGLWGEGQDLPYVGGWAADQPVSGFGNSLGFMPMVGMFDYVNPCCTSPHGEFSTVMRTSTNWDGTPRFGGQALFRGAWLYRIVDPCGVSSVLDKCCPDEDNHGQYVSCTAKALSDLRDQGAITGRERGALQSSAARNKK